MRTFWRLLCVVVALLALAGCGDPQAATHIPATATNAARVTATSAQETPATNAAPTTRPPVTAPINVTATLKPAPLGQTQRDITYCVAGGVNLKMDVVLPQTLRSDPAPTVLFVHGGGWRSGNRHGGGLVESVTAELNRRGYVVAAIDYRLAPQYKFPAMIEDAKCAVRYLRVGAAAYHIDPTRIGAWGDSAGGHLVALLGLTDKNAGFEGSGGYSDQSSAVQAVVDMFGPTDLTNAILPNGSVTGAIEAVFSHAQLVTASPITYVKRDAPPIFIIQGDKDTIVRPAQSQELYDKLKAAGAPVSLLMVKNAGHEFMPIGGDISPSQAEIVQQVADFFDAHLTK